MDNASRPQGMGRFPAEVYSEEVIRDRGAATAKVFVGRLPSNYPDTLVSNTGAIFRTVAEEFERLHASLSLVGEDRFHEGARPEHLYQTLGALLYLGEKSLGAVGSDGVSVLSDLEYRDFLLKVRKACLGGSRVGNMEESLRSILGVPVVFKEMFKSARKRGSSLGTKDAHRLLCEIDMEASPSRNGTVTKLAQDITFYTDLLRPAHALLDTRLLWRENLGTVGGGRPLWGADQNGNRPVFSYVEHSSRFVSLLFACRGTPASDFTDWEEGTVSEATADTLTLSDGTTLRITPSSVFYDSDEEGMYRVDKEDMLVGDHVYFRGLDIPGDPSFLYTPPELASLGGAWKVDPTVAQRPAFYENVRVEMDPRGRFGRLDKGDGFSERKVTDTLETSYEDLRDDQDYPSFFRASYTVQSAVPGAQYTSGCAPLLGPSGVPATSADVEAYVDGVLTAGVVDVLDAARGVFRISSTVAQGSEVSIHYWHSKRFPGKVVSSRWFFPVNGGASDDLPGLVEVLNPNDVVKRLAWPFQGLDPDRYGGSQDIQADRCPMLGPLGTLATVADIEVFLDGAKVEGGVDFVRPLLGHVHLTFVPPPGSTVTLGYYYTEKSRGYPFRTDDPSYTFDAFYGSAYAYNLVPDVPASLDPSQPVAAYGKILEIGHRYRAFRLSNSAVLNSRDTFVLNDVDVRSLRGSYGPTEGVLGAVDVLYSPEHLEDGSLFLELGDSYLRNGMPAVNRLHKGTPTFQQTFTDRGDYSDEDYVAQEQSGLVEHAPLPDYRENGHLFLYSDLREVLDTSGTDVPLSSLSDSRSLGVAFGISETYFPNREMRLNDYMDYVKWREDDVVHEGVLGMIPGSRIVKSRGTSWATVPVNATMYVGDERYQVTRVINNDTLELHAPLSGERGDRSYRISMSVAEDVRVRLVDVIRKVSLPITDMSPYSRIYTDKPGEYRPWEVSTSFPDPDGLDGYPRNPGNPAYPDGTSPVLLSELHDDSGQRDLGIDNETATKMVRWRNWDQCIVVVGAGRMKEETPVSVMDDIADIIRIRFWDWDMAAERPVVFVGAVVETSEFSGYVLPGSVKGARIRYSGTFDPAILGDTEYELWDTVIRQLRPDGLVDVHTVLELKRKSV